MIRAVALSIFLFLPSRPAPPEPRDEPFVPPEPPAQLLPLPVPADPPAAPLGPPARQVRVIRCLVTAYTPYDPQDRKHGHTGLTSTQLRCSEVPHGIAADPRALPYGTLVRVPGYKPSRYVEADAWWPVDDTGGDLRKNYRRGIIHLDLRFRTRAAALRWGSRWVDVEVLLPADTR